MFIGLVHLELYIPEVRSLKHKRSVLLWLKNKLRDKFNASVIETDYKDKWQRSVVSVAMLREGRSSLDQAIDELVNYVQMVGEVDLIDWEVEVI